MPPSASKISMSPSELAQLEHGFATDPTSDAYRPLAEAYLSMGRYMEAMVVCKKGVKAHPSAASARVLLARVYAEQGKDKKALEELQGALQVAPDDLAALRMTGGILCKTGDLAAGGEHLTKALAQRADDPETLELFKKHGVPLPAKPQPPAAPPPPNGTPAGAAQAAPPAASPANAPPALASEAAAPAQPSLQARPSVAAPARRAAPAPQARPPAAAPARRAAPAQGAQPASYEDLASRYGEPDAPPRHRGPSAIIALVAAVVLSAAGLTYYTVHERAVAANKRTVDKLLRQMREELTHDSYAGYKKACEYGEKIVGDVSIDEDMLLGARSYLAYGYALRWGEHGEGEVAEKSAVEYLAKAKSFKKDHSHAIAAEAYIKLFGGNALEAERELEDIVEKKGKTSALLLSTLGIIEMHAGELDKALTNLKLAHELALADPRINAALGNVLRRQGDEAKAANFFDTALRNERDHAEAQLGVALMAIDSGKLDTADKYVNKLLAADPPPSPRQLALAHLAHAIVLDDQGKAAEGDKEQERAFEADARNGELYVLKARRLMRASRGDEAVAAIREAIKLDPRRASFYVDLARALIAKPGGAKEAVETLKQALKTVPSPKLLVLLGNAYLAAEQLDLAKDSYEKALVAAKDKMPEARMALADLARGRKDWTGAIDLYKKAVDEYLSSPERKAYALTQIGRIAEEQLGDRKEALERYKVASSADGTYPPPVFLIGRMFLEDKDKKKRDLAVTFLKKYLDMDGKGEFVAEANRLLAEKR